MARPTARWRGPILKSAWTTVRSKAGVKGRWHDNRHTLITELAEPGAGDETIMSIAGHVSKQMLQHYSHIRMEAKRKALESIVARPTAGAPDPKQDEKIDAASEAVSAGALSSTIPTKATTMDRVN